MFQLCAASKLKQMLSGSSAPLVIDARRRYEFNAGHIPGAICMRWEQWCQPAPESASRIMRQPGWWGKLAQPDEESFGERLGMAGIGHDQPIVVYADSARSKGRDARIAWMLLYLGAKTVLLLDGGWQGWLESNGEIQVLIESPPVSKFVVTLDSDRRCLLDNILSASEGRAQIGIDTRTQEEHRGEIYDYQPRKGKIPNTVNIPFFSLYDGNEFLSKQAFQALVSRTLHDRRPDFTYCEVGVRAATVSLLHELYTGVKLPLYDGSFMEWSFNQNLPVECD